jgi:hypothetical protein
MNHTGGTGLSNRLWTLRKIWCRLLGSPITTLGKGIVSIAKVESTHIKRPSVLDLSQSWPFKLFRVPTAASLLPRNAN